MNIRTTLAQIADELDKLNMHDEADTVDGVLQQLSETFEDVTPESILQRPDAGVIISEARGWVNDCQWDDQEEIDSYDDMRILRGVDRHYSGGLKQFLQDMNPV